MWPGSPVHGGLLLIAVSVCMTLQLGKFVVYVRHADICIIFLIVAQADNIEEAIDIVNRNK